MLNALVLFKKLLLPNDNPTVRNNYVKMTEHGSDAVISIAALIKAESLNERMTLTGQNADSSTSEAIAA